MMEDHSTQKFLQTKLRRRYNGSRNACRKYLVSRMWELWYRVRIPCYYELLVSCQRSSLLHVLCVIFLLLMNLHLLQMLSLLSLDLSSSFLICLLGFFHELSSNHLGLNSRKFFPPVVNIINSFLLSFQLLS